MNTCLTSTKYSFIDPLGVSCSVIINYGDFPYPHFPFQLMLTDCFYFIIMVATGSSLVAKNLPYLVMMSYLPPEPEQIIPIS